MTLERIIISSLVLTIRLWSRDFYVMVDESSFLALLFLKKLSFSKLALCSCAPALISFTMANLIKGANPGFFKWEWIYNQFGMPSECFNLRSGIILKTVYPTQSRTLQWGTCFPQFICYPKPKSRNVRSRLCWKEKKNCQRVTRHQWLMVSDGSANQIASNVCRSCTKYIARKKHM